MDKAGNRARTRDFPKDMSRNRTEGAERPASFLHIRGRIYTIPAIRRPGVDKKRHAATKTATKGPPLSDTFSQ